MFNTTQANEAPYLAAGGNALTALQSGLGLGQGGNGVGNLNAPFTLQDFQNSPGYQFQVQQGQNSILNTAAATGGVRSGNTLKALQSFGQGTANQDYWNAYNAYTNNQNTQFNRLQTLAGSGQNAAAQLGALGSQVASNVGSNTIGAGNATAAGTVGQANALNNGINGVGQNFLLAAALNPSMFGGSSYTGGLTTGGGGGWNDINFGF